MAGHDAHNAIARPLALGDGTGPRVGVKECIDIAGIPTRCGSAALADTIPARRHATVVRRLLDSGCRVIGTTNMHELAFGVSGINALGTPTNPAWPELIPGGSSSGSAVLAASGACDFSLGTDTGGSVRMPACCCGVYGFKPTFGLIDRDGIAPAHSSLDCVGIFARDPAMIVRAMSALVPGFEASMAIGPFRLKRVAADAEADVLAAVDHSLDGLTSGKATLHELGNAFSAGMTIIGREAWLANGWLLDRGGLGADVAERLGKARTVTDEQVAAAERVRSRFSAEVDAALDGVDALCLPTLPSVPPGLIHDSSALLPLTAFVRPFNLSGHPAMSIPIRTAAGLPAGLQLVGRKGGDATICAIALWLARHRPQTFQPA